VNGFWEMAIRCGVHLPGQALRLWSPTCNDFTFTGHLNGRRVEDEQGKEFPSADEACSSTLRRTPAHLKKAVRHANDNHLAIEVTDGKRTFYIVRGKTLVEKV
jgi:hypothetical protein